MKIKFILIPSFSLQNLLLAIIFVILALSVLTQANPGTAAPGRDYGFYVYIGEQITKGKIPYRDVWESKPPAIFYLNAIALWIGRGSRWGVWVVEFLFLLAAMVTSFLLLKKLWGFIPALFGIFIWVFGLDIVLNGGNFTEEFPLVFHFISLLIFHKMLRSSNRWYYSLLLGLMASFSILFRPNNAAVECAAIMILASTYLFQKKARSLFLFAVWCGTGIVIPLLVTSIYFARQGLFQALIDASFIYNLAYSRTKITTISPISAGFEHLPLPLIAALTGYILAAFQIKKYFRQTDFPLFLLLLTGMPFVIYTSDPARRNYAHYFINWLPFIALLSGFAFYNLGKILLYLKKHNYFSTLLVVIIALVLSFAQFTLSGRAGLYIKAVKRIINGPFIEMRTPISIYVENHTEPGDYVLFWAALPGENFMSNRDAPFSTLFYPLMVNSDISEKLNDDFLQDIKRTPPILVVDMGHLDPLSLDPQTRVMQRSEGVGWAYPPANLEEFFSIIKENYHVENVVKGKTVYRINDVFNP